MIKSGSKLCAVQTPARGSEGGWQKRAWLNGDWDVAAGQFFTAFRREVHADEDGVGGDDAADPLRYLVATKAREIRVMKLRGS